jgi:fatty acid desaturase
MALVLSDPTYAPREARSLFDRMASPFLRDKRDLPFLRLMALLTATVVPTGVLLFLPGPFRWGLAALHLGLIIYFLGPFVLMLHNTSHRKLFKRRFGWMNLYIPWVLGPFFGESPMTYFAHHVGMHHAENNLSGDISTTMPYRRDSIVDFSRYFLRFFFYGSVELTGYFLKKRRNALMMQFLSGEILFLGAAVGLFLVSWQATLTVLILPFVIVRFGMMAGNWAQHAFIDRNSPENNYRNSITCINSTYNRRCFNDGYHIGHHLKSTRHWTEMPGELLSNAVTYDEQGAIVFTGLDFFGVWACLMAKRYDFLAKRFVRLGDLAPQGADIITLLQSRTQWQEGRGASSGRHAPGDWDTNRSLQERPS